MTRPARVVVAAALTAVLVGCAQEPIEQAAFTTVEGETVSREFGITADPWHVDEWADVVGAKPTMVMEFEQWHRDRTLDEHFAEARRQGLTSFMVTWEPWAPVPVELGQEAQFADQPEYNNATIVSGARDDYIRAFADSVAASGLTVYIRYAHEMNGVWYPWSRDPDNYVRAWRHIVDIFREAGATNAKFVFSLNPSIWMSDRRWREDARRYWPGADYVDLIGSTMINFGGLKYYEVEEFTDRFALMYEEFHKPLIITEMNTAYDGRVKWLTDLRTWLVTQGSFVTGVVLAQAESRGQVHLGAQVGDLSWNVTSDPETQPVVRGMIEDLERPWGG